MRSEKQFSNLIYEYFLKRIQFRYYKCGDLLPSIDTLCREFSVSALTVKIGLQRLRAEGYIDMHNGRSTKVIFKQTQAEAYQCANQYFSRRIESFKDLYQTTEMIIMPLLLESFHRMDEQDLAFLDRLAKGSSADDILHFFCFVLQKMENPLAMNLYWETSFFWGLLFVKQGGKKDLSDLKIMHEEMGDCVFLAGRKDWASLHKKLQVFRKDSVGNAVESLSQMIPPAKGEKQIPFEWRIYRERPQVCYSLASHIMHHIYMGRYRDTDFLPSYERMAEEYRVSVSTVRRTIKVLNQLGAARTINGKGTRIFRIGEPCDATDFEVPAIRRNLAYFIQSFELLVFSCETVMREFLTAVSQEERNELIKELEENLDTGRCELSLWYCLLLIARYSPLQGIREIYGRIYSLFLWGYPLKTSYGRNVDSDRAMYDFTVTMISRLKENAIDACAETLREMAARQFPIAQQYLHQCGIRPEELRLTPSIRLVITDEV